MDILHLVDYDLSYQLFVLYQFQEEVSGDVRKAVEILKTSPGTIDDDQAMLRRIFREYQDQLDIIIKFEEGLASFYSNLLEDWE